MEAIYLILKSLFVGPIKAINALYDLLKAQKKELEIFATDEATTAKNDAISEAQKIAEILAKIAKDDAVLLAATEAALLANAAKNIAIADAKIDATQKAKSAQEAAIDASSFYTDGEITKLKLQAEQGYAPRFWEGLVTESKDVKGQLNILTPEFSMLDMSEKGHYTLNLTGNDANGKVIANTEFVMSLLGADGKYFELLVSTNDVLIYRTDDKGVTTFVKKDDNRLMEVVKGLEVQISTKVSNTDLEQAIGDVKAYVDGAIYAELLA